MNRADGQKAQMISLRGGLSWQSQIRPLLVCVLLSLSLSCENQTDEKDKEVSSVDPQTGIYLEQNWTMEEREDFLYRTQGSQIIPYVWFMNLQAKGSEELFRSDEVLKNYRFILASPTRLNPDGLPVGIAKDIDKFTKVSWMGLTCAACHTTIIQHNDKRYHVDGGAAMIDYSQFIKGLYDAMTETIANEKKWGAFAGRVMGGEIEYQSVDELKLAFQFQHERIRKRIEINASEHPYGYARVDALGAIFNKVAAIDLNIIDNKITSNAPVSYPFLWGAHQSDVVQWTGALPNGEGTIGPLLRNTGELLGVWGNIILDDSLSGDGSFYSSVKVANMIALEQLSEKLRSPPWPEGLGAIDEKKAARGKVLYDKNCASCHQIMSWDEQGAKYKAVMIPMEDVGTDPNNGNHLKSTSKTGRLVNKKITVVTGDLFEVTAATNDIVGHASIGAVLNHPLGQLIKDVSGDPDSVDLKPVEIKKISYKARPLTGIWSTAPYLHNGSVPTLYQLLKPGSERPKTFWVGSWEFDPKEVGFVYSEDDRYFKFDTTLSGNLNTGHEYGASLTDSERWDLVEYLKSL